MGWTCFQNQPRGGMQAAVIAALTWENEGIAARVLESKMVGGALYAAVERRKGDAVTVGAVVALIEGYGYKLIGEECGPCASQCPAEILALLSPTQSEWAQKWRARCAQAVQ